MMVQAYGTTPVVFPQVKTAAVVHARDVADVIKARSTLVALVQPAAWISQLASTPGQTLDTIGQIGSAIGKGQLGEAGGHLGDLVGRAMRPEGIPGIIYQTGLYAQAGVDALVGTVELYEGSKSGDRYLKLMGAADLVGSGSSLAFAMGGLTTALALNVVSNTAKTALVLMRPQEFSRIQKAKTLFDACASISASLMKAGIAGAPALAGYVGFGVTQILYMNNEAFRGKVDRAVDWVIDKFK